MGLGKSLKKAIKKVTKPIEGITKGALGVATGLLGGGMPDVPQAAQIVEPPSKGDVATADGSQTESGKKKTRASGKKSLSVARSSGGGLNI